MYYYFTNKEHLLYQIQRRTFESLLEAQTDLAAAPGSAGERLRRLITGHLAFFAAHPNEMKVCTFELDSLTGASYRSVLDIRRRYYRVMASVVAEAMDGPGRKGRETARSRKVTLSLFGMLNWVFMWYDPSKDGTIDSLGGEMTQLILRGISPERNR